MFTKVNKTKNSFLANSKVLFNGVKLYKRGLIGKNVDFRLTEREQNVINLVVRGLTNNEIAGILHISVHTVKAHLEAIYYKFGVVNRVQAAIKAVILGLVDIKALT